MPGIRDLRRIQLAEQTWGYGPVVPTTQLVGMLDATENRNRMFPREATGIMSSVRRFYDQSIIAELAFDAGDEGATYEQLIIFLSMAITGGVTPTPVGAGGHLWTFAPNLGAGNRPDIYTLRYGDNQRCWQSAEVFATEMRLAGATEEPWRLTADLVGDQMDPDSFEVIAYPVPLETILAQMTSLYIDNSWATLGSTPILGTLIDWEVTIPAFHPKFFQDGDYRFSDIGLASRSLAVSFTFEFTAGTVAERLLWVAGTPRFIRLEAVGSMIYDAMGLPIDNHRSIIDMCVIYEGTEPLDERDGNDIMRFTGLTAYDPTGIGHEFEFRVQNTIPALP